MILIHSCPKVTDEMLRHVGEGLGSLSELRQIHLSFEKCRAISDDGFRFLVQGLTNCTSLREMSFNFFE